MGQAISKSMNYQKIYDNLIKRSFHRKLEGYSEKHHIIPRCMGGSDTFSNLAILTPEEHYLAHQLLVKIYPDNRKIILAALMMSTATIYKKRNNKLYGWLKRRHSESMKGRRWTKKFKIEKIKTRGRQRDNTSIFNLYLEKNYPELIKLHKSMTKEEKALYARVRNYVIKNPIEVITSFYR